MDRTQLIKERHEALRNGTARAAPEPESEAPNRLERSRRWQAMLKEMGPLATLAEAQAQSRKEGIGELGPATYYRVRTLLGFAKGKPGRKPRAQKPPSDPARGRRSPARPTAAPLGDAVTKLVELKRTVDGLGGFNEARQLLGQLEELCSA